MINLVHAPFYEPTQFTKRVIKMVFMFCEQSPVFIVIYT
uniref:Uncharacterized protein n=1 Tax=Ciona intestinalis TaxID=7719 RepID=H2XSW7_CIOIN